MPKFFMLIGLPGSGKSTYARKLAEDESAAICSSDAIREELFWSEDDQEHNQEVFNTLHSRIISGLKSGKNMIYDATNTISKNRRAFLQQISKIDCYKVAVVVATPYEECLRRNKLRERQVPDCIIKRMYLNFNIPCIQEGFSEVKIAYPESFEMIPYIKILDDCYALPHDNPHHPEAIGKHMILAYNHLEAEHSEFIDSLSETDSLTIEMATMLHDIGKPLTKEFKNSRGEQTDIAHFFNHNNVGAYEVLFTDIPNEIKVDVALLIQYHMQYYISWNNSKKSEVKDRQFLGERLSNMLDILHDCDLNAR